jgi:hypothetical protein
MPLQRPNLVRKRVCKFLPSNQGASKKKEKGNKEEKNNPGKKQPTDFPSFFFF